MAARKSVGVKHGFGVEKGRFGRLSKVGGCKNKPNELERIWAQIEVRMDYNLARGAVVKQYRGTPATVMGGGAAGVSARA